MAIKKINLFLLIFIFIVISCFAQSLYTLEGKQVSKEDLLKSKKVILLFWNTLCPYCQFEIKRLNENLLFEKYADIEFFYIDIGESPKTIMKYTKAAKLSEKIVGRILIDKFGKVAQFYNIIGIPTYVFIKDKEVVYRSFYLNDKILKEVFSGEL